MKKVCFISAGLVLALVFIVFLVFLAYPRNLHYSRFNLRVEYNNNESTPLGCYVEEPGLLLIYAKTCMPDAPKRVSAGTGGSMLQLSGVGFRGGVGSNGFYSDYHWLKTSPRIIFKDGEISKTFFIKNALPGKCIIEVDNQIFNKGNKPHLVLLINEDGSIEEIQDFKKTFGLDINTFLDTINNPVNIRFQDRGITIEPEHSPDEDADE